jgi:methionyl-tRNA formyltransferase
MKLVLFCNLAYGSAALEALAALSKREPMFELTVVLSLKGASAEGTLRRKLRGTWRRRRLARELGVRVLGADDVNAPELLAQLPPQAHGLVVGFNQIFRAPTIAHFATLTNAHPSLLPFYRGPVPSHWALARGERHSGCTLHRLVEAVDSGAILAQVPVETEGCASAGELDQRIAQRSLPVLVSWVEHLRDGRPWTSTSVDACAFYSNPVDYLSFPG